jgi:hypothetical protein
MSSLGDVPDHKAVEDDRERNGFAVAGLVLSVLFDPLLLGLIFSILGLVRSARVGVGKAMAWTGIAISVAWLAVTFVYVVPAVTAKFSPGVARAEKQSDPGCQAVQALLTGPLGSKDLTKDKDTQTLATDLQGVVTSLRQAAAKAQDATARAAITKLASDYSNLLNDVKSGKEAASTLQAAVTVDGNAVDEACGVS